MAALQMNTNQNRVLSFNCAVSHVPVPARTVHDGSPERLPVCQEARERFSAQSHIAIVAASLHCNVAADVGSVVEVLTCVQANRFPSVNSTHTGQHALTHRVAIDAVCARLYMGCIGSNDNGKEFLKLAYPRREADHPGLRCEVFHVRTKLVSQSCLLAGQRTTICRLTVGAPEESRNHHRLLV